VIAPILGGHAADAEAVLNPQSTKQVNMSQQDVTDVEKEKDVVVKMTSDEGVFTAEVITETKMDGFTKKETNVFTGTEAEVMAKIEAMKSVEVSIE
jgi:K(+)-stimulated pyrophosphate-energized sodium pump